MSELIADLFISVDGCAKGSRSPAFFGFGGPDLDRWIGEQMKRPQRHLMGRKTYEALAALPEPVHDEGSPSLAATPTTVFSRTIQAVSWPHATVSDDLAGTVGRLKAGDTDLRTIGSLSLVSQLLQAGLVDRLRLLVFPLSPRRPDRSRPSPSCLTSAWTSWGSPCSTGRSCSRSTVRRARPRTPASAVTGGIRSHGGHAFLLTEAPHGCGRVRAHHCVAADRRPGE
jgi:dihydrofolate reductase